jgi:hypothetical protein
MVLCVKYHAVTDTAFWFLLFRMLVFPHKSHTAKQLYETLLPALNYKPIMRNLDDEDEESQRMHTFPIYGDPTLVHCVLESFRYATARQLKPQQGRYIMFLIRWEMCRMCANDLKLFTADQFRSSDAHLIRLALRHLSRHAAEACGASFSSTTAIASADADADTSAVSTKQLREVQTFLDQTENQLELLSNPQNFPQVQSPPPHAFISDYMCVRTHACVCVCVCRS